MFNKLFNILLIIAFLMPNLLFAESLDKLISRFENIDTMHARFIQKTEIKGFGEDVYKGEIYLINNEKVLWDYNKPYEQYYLFSTDTMEYYDSSTDQLIKQRVTSSSGNNIVFQLLVDIGKIKDSFMIEKISENKFRLTPKSDMGLKYLTMTFGEKYLEKIYSVDKKGNHTEITFENVRLNVDIPAGVFDKEVPLGTEIFNY
ncbi:outer membrane lipoprotein carrier protein LolA [Flexistipes sinusarabici]|uniref:LolA family protein n=1 Tax=Flexistipes sinusarabici TaxID=2352 RepID=UPI0026EF2D23|nr:outer membrane lipoprotein carrier protein LolA [Flexistipes sinusarabici]